MKRRMLPARAAIAMIELIFSIVIIGIVLLSVPMLVGQTTKSNIVGFQQESISLAASEISKIMSYAWDESNTDTFSTMILATANGDSELAPANSFANTPGAVNTRIRRFDTINNPIASAIGPDAGEANITQYDDIDDFDTATTSMEVIAASNAANDGEFIDQSITSTIRVGYGTDVAAYAGTGPLSLDPFNGAPAGVTNIKIISLTLTSGNTADELKDKNITLRALSCNIGAGNVLQGRR